MSNDESSATRPMQAPPGLRSAVERLERNDVLDRAANRLQPATQAIGEGRLGETLRGRWLGHALHPLLTDLPLGCWIGAGLLDLVGGRRSRPAARRLVGLGLLAVPVTVASGLVDWSDLTEPRVRRVGVAHAAGNGAVATLYLVSWLSRRRDRHAVALGAAFAGGGLAFVTGYLGGHLSFARGAGVGPRGLEDEGRADGAASKDAADDDELLDPHAAMAVLGVEREQLDAMVADELLVARAIIDDAPRFARSDLVAVRMVGG